jgi:hypothetical protein
MRFSPARRSGLPKVPLRWVVLFWLAVFSTACSAEDPPSAAPPPAATPSAASPATPSQGSVPVPTAVPGGSFYDCLRSHGVRLSKRNSEPEGDPVLIRKSIERCTSLLNGTAVRIPVAKDSRFQACLAEHKVKMPPVGEWLSLNPNDPTMAQALEACA